MRTDHERLDGGSGPSWASVAEPEKLMMSPTFQVDPLAGDWIVTVGGELPGVTVTNARPLAPSESVTWRPTNSVPAEEYVRVGATAVESPKTPSPFKSHE